MDRATSTGVKTSLVPARRRSSSKSSCRSTLAPVSLPPNELLLVEWLRLRLMRKSPMRTKASLIPPNVTPSGEGASLLEPELRGRLQPVHDGSGRGVVGDEVAVGELQLGVVPAQVRVDHRALLVHRRPP